ncbi:PE-PPE domain-containing protein [Mycolicibacterium sp. P1-5]|uniref:PE-PPE domain-containing protein n=1 Tax=Mycolicibacterium sp. P1-5 TaxID=2024617 RepID=UPI0011ED430A|nr:PE-PPE domain-containing protein [Mycolicibacterium sp. P1-5]KAA0104144.1 PE-PPE domain-containing protein [Mycolicibacterium sp. P1-5]
MSAVNGGAAMGIFRRAVESVAVGCAGCLVLAGPAFLSAGGYAQAAQTPPTSVDVLSGLEAGSYPALSDAKISTSSTSWLIDDLGVPADAVLVDTPGTDDKTLYPRIDPMRGSLDTAIVEFPQSLFPVVSGQSGAWLPIFAPTYDESVNVAIDHNLLTMRGLKQATDNPYVVYSGYSQGADAVGDAAEQAYAAGLLDPTRTQIVLVSDPRSPWGIKQWASSHSLVSALANLIGVTADGARNPADTGPDLPVTSVVIAGDPVANFQWVWYRPLASLVVDVAGFLAIHSNMGPECYATLDQIQDKEVFYSRDGKTTYAVYHAQHPLTQIAEIAAGAVGIHFSDTQVAQLNDFNNWFYPLQQPSPERGAATVPATSTRPAANSVDNQSSVTVSAVSSENPPPQRVERTMGGASPRELRAPTRQFVGTRGPAKQARAAASPRDQEVARSGRGDLRNLPDRNRVRPPVTAKTGNPAPRSNAKAA